MSSPVMRLRQRLQQARKHQQQPGKQPQHALDRRVSPQRPVLRRGGERARARRAVFARDQTMSQTEPPFGIFISRPTPCGSSTNTNGTRNAGSVYFQACIVVL